MAKYLILIYGDEQQWAAMIPAGAAAARRRPRAPSAPRPARRSSTASELEPAPSRPRCAPTRPAGRRQTDGPFLETKEALGGYYLLEAADLDEVIALAARLPEVAAGHSGVEIRPVVDHG